MGKFMKQIALKKDWDISINFPIDNEQIQGHFVGRESELKLLTNEILRRTSGAILVSGYRGVGKTSLVYKALWEARKKNKNIVVILLNAAQLEAESETEKSKIHPRKIIENLIKRLYSTTKNSNLPTDIKEEVKKLYRKAIAKEFKLLESFQKRQELSERITIEKIYEFLSEINIRNVIFLISWLIAVTLQFTSLTPWPFLNKLAPLIFAFPLPYAVNLLYKKRLELKKLEESIGKTEELYEFDNSIGNLEFDLEQIHKKFKAKGKKLIYVIDELDKLDVTQVINVLKLFKNLFTLSDAIFIFIGGEEIYNYGERKKTSENLYRPKEYTYFTSKYFLCRPLWADLNNFFNEIIETKDIDDNSLELLKRAIVFEAKNDFFDLIKFIKDRVTDFDNTGRPIIEIDNISEDDIKKARLHKAITVLFEGKYITFNYSKWLENELILRTLFKHAHDIYLSYSGYQITDPSQDKIEDSAIRDFNEFLYRQGALRLQDETSQIIRGMSIPIRTYQYTGNVPTDIPDQLDELAEFEKRFINKFQTLATYILLLNNVFRVSKGDEEITQEEFWKKPVHFTQQINNWGFDALNQFNAHYPIYKNLVNRKPPYPYRREDIENRTNQIDNYIKTMLQNLPNIIAHILRSLNVHLNLQIQHLQQNASLFGGSAIQIRNNLSGLNPLVVFKQDLSRQILIIYNHIDTVLNVRNQIKDNAKTHRIVCFADKKEQLDIEGFHIVYINDPKTTRDGLIKLFKKLNKFLQE